MSSLVGACFGAITIALAIPLIRPLVLAIGYGEFFMLSLLGVTLVAALSEGSLIKGLASGLIGLLISMIGLTEQTGIQRFTFGFTFLWDGVGLVPVTLGLFAIPELIELAVKRTSISEKWVGEVGGVRQGIRDTFHHWGLVLRCSAIGTFFGVIPGMGAVVSQWLAYAHCVQSSPEKSRFGKGAVEGVLGPGAANNSTLGGNLIPTIAFGVPGSVMTAILLGAFIIQGLIPGPNMLIPEQAGGHLTLTFSLVAIIIVSNVLTVGLCLAFLKHLVRVTQVRSGLIIPLILLFIYAGAFTERNAFEDLLIMLLAGFFGQCLVKYDWPRPPLLLGLVLGPIMETNLFLATGSDGWAWLGHPGVLIVAGLMLAGVIYSYKKRGRNGNPPSPSASPGAMASFSLFVVLLFVGTLICSKDWNWRTGLFPWVIGASGILFAGLQLKMDFKRLRSGLLPTRSDATLPVWGWILSFFMGIWLLGFSAASVLNTVIYLRLNAREPWRCIIPMAAFMGVLFGAIFEYLLHVPFPEGLLVGLVEKIF